MLNSCMKLWIIPIGIYGSIRQGLRNYFGLHMWIWFFADSNIKSMLIYATFLYLQNRQREGDRWKCVLQHKSSIFGVDCEKKTRELEPTKSLDLHFVFVLKSWTALSHIRIVLWIASVTGISPQLETRMMKSLFDWNYVPLKLYEMDNAADSSSLRPDKSSFYNKRVWNQSKFLNILLEIWRNTFQMLCDVEKINLTIKGLLVGNVVTHNRKDPQHYHVSFYSICWVPFGRPLFYFDSVRC